MRIVYSVIARNEAISAESAFAALGAPLLRSAMGEKWRFFLCFEKWSVLYKEL